MKFWSIKTKIVISFKAYLKKALFLATSWKKCIYLFYFILLLFVMVQYFCKLCGWWKKGGQNDCSCWVCVGINEPLQVEQKSEHNVSVCVLGGVSVSQSFQWTQEGVWLWWAEILCAEGDGKLPGSIRQVCTHLYWCVCMCVWVLSAVNEGSHLCSSSPALLFLLRPWETGTSKQFHSIKKGQPLASWPFIPVQWINQRATWIRHDAEQSTSLYGARKRGLEVEYMR